jgi:sialic acid synthase SpsE
MTFICDLGSGNTCKNNPNTVKEMIDALAEVDPRRKVILKWQLFTEAWVCGNNIPLDHIRFRYAYDYATKLGFKTTASVFDKESLVFLLSFDIPFVKIANRPDLYWLIGEVPRKIPIITSLDTFNLGNIHITDWDRMISCISKYPCDKKEYEINFSCPDLQRGISDHTTNWELFKKYHPQVYECHFKLSNSTGADAGDFARTPEQIKEIYEEID